MKGEFCSPYENLSHTFLVIILDAFFKTSTCAVYELNGNFASLKKGLHLCAITFSSNARLYQKPRSKEGNC